MRPGAGAVQEATVAMAITRVSSQERESAQKEGRCRTQRIKMRKGGKVGEGERTKRSESHRVEGVRQAYVEKLERVEGIHVCVSVECLAAHGTGRMRKAFRAES